MPRNKRPIQDVAPPPPVFSAVPTVIFRNADQSISLPLEAGQTFVVLVRGSKPVAMDPGGPGRWKISAMDITAAGDAPFPLAVATIPRDYLDQWTGLSADAAGRMLDRVERAFVPVLEAEKPHLNG